MILPLHILCVIYIALNVLSAEILRLPCNKLDGHFRVLSERKRLPKEKVGYIGEYSNLDVTICVALCIKHLTCKSVNFHAKNRRCRIFSKDTNDDGVILKDSKNWDYMEASNDEKTGSTSVIYMKLYTLLVALLLFC